MCSSRLIMKLQDMTICYITTDITCSWLCFPIKIVHRFVFTLHILLRHIKDCFTNLIDVF